MSRNMSGIQFLQPPNRDGEYEYNGEQEAEVTVDGETPWPATLKAYLIIIVVNDWIQYIN